MPIFNPAWPPPPPAASPALCPGCKNLMMVLRSYTWDPFSTNARWEFSCPVCGVDLDIELPDSVDAGAEITRYANTGQMPAGMLNVSVPTRQFTSGGAVYPPSPPTSWSLPVVYDPEPPPPKPDPGPGVELRALEGSVIGYRAWRIEDWVLAGTGVSEPWKPGINEAKCSGLVPGAHKSPAEGCQCGLYALARFDDKTSWWEGADALGAVEAWADTDEDNHDRFFIHSTGFRAQYAKVILLATSDDYPRAKNAAIRALAAEHGADVCKREHLEDAAKEHGQLVPDEWLAWAKEDDRYLDGTYPSLFGSMQAFQQIGINAQQAMQALSNALAGPPAKLKGPKPRKRPQGICRTLGYPGPPGHGKYRKGNRVRDPRGDVYVCTRGGQPGTWALEGV